MKKMFQIVSSFALCCFVAVLFSASAFAEKPRIAIVDFQNASQVTESQLSGSAVADMMVDELVNRSLFNVIERERLKSILEEQKLGISGAVTADTASQLGELLGVKYIAVGKIVKAGVEKTNFGGLYQQSKIKVELTMRLIDTSTGAIIFSGKGEGVKGKAKADLSSLLGDSHAKYSEHVDSSVFSEAAQDAIVQIVDKLAQKNLSSDQ